MGQYGKYTPEQKAMIGKRATEYGVVVNLCIPDRFILVVTSYHSFHDETRGHYSTCARGVWFILSIFYHESLQIRASTKNLPPPPPQKKKLPAIHYIGAFSPFKMLKIVEGILTGHTHLWKYYS